MAFLTHLSHLIVQIIVLYTISVNPDLGFSLVVIASVVRHLELIQARAGW